MPRAAPAGPGLHRAVHGRRRQARPQLASVLGGACSQLTALELCGVKADDSSPELLQGLASLKPRLRRLGLAGSLLQGQQLLALAGCCCLTALSLASNDLSYERAGLSQAALLGELLSGSAGSLRELDLSGAGLESPALGAVFACTQLTRLHLGAHRFRYFPNALTSLRGVAGLQGLVHLDIGASRLSCCKLAVLRGLAALTLLCLAENDLGGRCWT